MSADGTIGILEQDPGILGYIPNRTVCIIMIALFGLSTIAHSGQAVYSKTWFLFPTAVLCGAMETLGWVGRLWLNSSPWNEVAFQIQICTTIIAPTPLLAATFVIFGEVIRRLGTAYSRLSPRLYTLIFLTCDVVSLVVQAVGGGLAATAEPENGDDPEFGGRIMLGGIAFQLAVIVIFSICAVEYVVRYFRDAPIRDITSTTTSPRSSQIVSGQSEKKGRFTISVVKHQDTERGELTGKMKVVLGALVFSTLVLFIRAIYRTIELTDGWNGRIIETEVYFNVLDGAMIVLAIYTLNFVHPGPFLYNANAVKTVPESDATTAAYA